MFVTELSSPSIPTNMALSRLLEPMASIPNNARECFRQVSEVTICTVLQSRKSDTGTVELQIADVSCQSRQIKKPFNYVAYFW